MDKLITVFRNPFRSTIAEFTRRTYAKTSGYENIEDFKKTAEKKNRLAKQARNNLFKLTDHILKLNQTDRPVLYISYEDMTENLMPQLLRILNFVGLAKSDEYLERAVCTVLNTAKQKNAKRVTKIDVSKASRKLIDSEKMMKKINRLNQDLIKAGAHYLRESEYVADILGE